MTVAERRRIAKESLAHSHKLGREIDSLRKSAVKHVNAAVDKSTNSAPKSSRSAHRASA